jgi:hypothetical protein
MPVAAQITEYDLVCADDLVIFKPTLRLPPELRAKVYRVDSVGRTKVSVTGTDGKNYMLKLEQITRAPEGTVWTGPDKPEAAPVVLGSVVTLNGTFKVRGTPPDTKFVVLAHVGTDKVRLAHLGGDGDRYVTGVPKTALTIVQLEI